MSLRTRLLAGLAFVAVVLCVAAVAITSTVRSHLVDQIDDQLEQAVDPAREGRFPAPGRVPPANPRPAERPAGDTAPDLPERLSAMFEGFVQADGELVIFFESNLPGAEFSVPDVEFETLVGRVGEPFTTDSIERDTSYRVLAIEASDGVFLRALPLAGVEETLQRLVLFGLIGIAAVLATLAAVALWVVRLGIRPLRAMAIAADDIGESDISARLPEPAAVGTEAAALARTLNRMIARLETAIDDRAQSEDRLRQFVSDASHELRTPVTTIRGYAELYRMGGLNNGEALDDAMRRTGQEAERMARLVDDMLTLAKHDQHRPLEISRVDLGNVLEDLVADLAVTAPTHTVVAAFSAAASSSGLASALVVEGDEDRLRQLFANVLGNAAIHTPTGSTIEVSAEAEEGDVVVIVSDNGPGVTGEELERLTERFYRPDSSRSRERGGSGLGLSIVTAAAEAHGGSIEIDSGVDEGTVVTIRLPRVQSGDGGVHAEAASR